MNELTAIEIVLGELTSSMGSYQYVAENIVQALTSAGHLETR